jgi:hypothetical protein
MAKLCLLIFELKLRPLTKGMHKGRIKIREDRREKGRSKGEKEGTMGKRGRDEN